MLTSSQRKARNGEAIFLASLLLVSIILIMNTFKFKVVPWDPLGMSFWPRVQLGILVVAIIARIITINASYKKDRGGFLRGIGILFSCVVFAYGLNLLGLYISAPAFLILFALLRKSNNRHRDILLTLFSSLVVVLGIWLLFDITLDLRVLTLPYWMR